MKSVLRPSSNRQPPTKEPKKKKTLKEVAGTMLSDLVEKAHQERVRPLLEKRVRQEDEIAAMMFGPNWNDSSSTNVPSPPDSSIDFVKKKENAA